MDDNALTVLLVFALVVAVAAGAGGSSYRVPSTDPAQETHPADGTLPPVPPGQPGNGSIAPGTDSSTGHPQYTSDEKLLLARLIHAEAEGEPSQGQVAVGATVLNRVESEAYPDTIHDVIYQVESGYVQYEVVANGRINLPPDESSIAAAERALKGEDPSYGALGFYNPSHATNWWVLSRPVTTVIGNLVFYR